MDTTTAIILILAALLCGGVIGARGDAMAYRRMGKVVKANTRSQDKLAELFDAVKGAADVKDGLIEKRDELHHQMMREKFEQANTQRGAVAKSLADINTTLTLLCETLASEAAHRAERDPFEQALAIQRANDSRPGWTAVVGGEPDEVPGSAHAVEPEPEPEKVTGPVTPNPTLAKGRKYVQNKATGVLHRTGRFRQANGSVVGTCYQAPYKSSKNYREVTLTDQEMLDMADDPRARMCRNCKPMEAVTK